MTIKSVCYSLSLDKFYNTTRHIIIIDFGIHDLLVNYIIICTVGSRTQTQDILVVCLQKKLQV